MIRVLYFERGSKFENRFSSFFLFSTYDLKGNCSLKIIDWLDGFGKERRGERILRNDGIKGMTSFRGVLSLLFREIRGIGRFDKGLGKDYAPRSTSRGWVCSVDRYCH